ncbi:MAG: hypothetical protein M1826_006941 [Phylliscum demangeonii]|nr:MAG: hypothetical protein M1826_006941 [Phylliscum demangeonii]
MIDPALILVASLLLLSAGGGAWALPAPAPARPPARPYHGPADPSQIFPPGQLSRLGKAGMPVPGRIHIDSGLLERARGHPALRAKYAAYEQALASQEALILEIMKRDDVFLDCVEAEMGKSFVGLGGAGPSPAATVPHDMALFFFAAEVCQRRGQVDFNIRFPRVEYYFAGYEEDPRYSEARIVARADAKASNNAFHVFRVPALPKLHAWERMMSHVAGLAHRVVTGARKQLPWPARWEADPNAALVRLESHY